MDILFGAVLFHRSVCHAAQVFAEEGDGLVQHLAVVTERQLKVANAVVADLVECGKNIFPDKTELRARIAGREMLVKIAVVVVQMQKLNVLTEVADGINRVE
ncbi:MAG: hypothetical protein IKC43_02130, partial [Clostridia bacterium]|nr:hypothetical protein [Clostridia bacterium]